MAAAPKTKKTVAAVAPKAKASAKKKAPPAAVTTKAATKMAPSHPPYIQMITEALVALKERTGSSQYAIAKHIEEEQKIKDLPTNFKKLLSVQLKRFVASGKLVMVKKSFKLPPKTSKTASPTAAAAAPKAKAVPKPKAAVKEVKKTKSLKVVKSPMKKKAVVSKAKKPKSIKSPVKKTVAAAKKVVKAAKK